MQKIIPSLAAHPLDEVAAATVWFRLSNDSLADIVPYLSDARCNQGVWFYDLTNPNIQKFTSEQRAQEGGPKSPVYDMLASVGHLFREMEALRKNVGGICVEVCFEKDTPRPDGAMKITVGNKDLNNND